MRYTNPYDRIENIKKQEQKIEMEDEKELMEEKKDKKILFKVINDKKNCQKKKIEFLLTRRES